jgi:hypothetical protein
MTATLFALLLVAAPSAEADTAPPAITFVPCEAFQKGRTFSVFARFDDASPLFEPKLVYRISGDASWRNVPFKAQPDGAVWKASVGAKELTGALEYFVEAFDENGNGPARVGSPEEPLFARLTRKAPECTQPDQLPAIASTVEAGMAPDGSPSSLFASGPQEQAETSRCKRDDPPVYCKYWFWIAAGGAVVATAAVIAIAADHGSGRDYPDHVTLVVQPQALEHGR